MDDDDALPTPRRPSAASDTELEMVAGWVEICVDLLRADGAAVIVAPTRTPDVRRVVYATGDTAARVANVLDVLGPGSHDRAAPDGDVRTLVVDDPVDTGRWPLMMAELAALGVRRVSTFPIVCGPGLLGVLQLHRTAAPDGPVPSDVEGLVGAIARHVAPDVSGALTAYVCRDTGDDVIAVSIGVLMARHHLTASDATALLRTQSYTADTTVATHARTIADSLGT